jgi:pyridoxal phosphate enzyme (YggS family)
MSSLLPARLAATRKSIADAARAAGRDPEKILLLAVSKTKPAQMVREAALAGQRHFGENYAQEGAAKVAALADFPEKLVWHFIGPVQGNKTRIVAEHFDWVHAIDRERIARRLSEQRPAQLPPLQACIEVNISGQESKSGVAPQDALALCRLVAGLPGLRLRGLMAIPEPAAGASEAERRRPFAAMKALFDGIRAAGIQLDTLSMGMSGDFAEAIAEGSTLVRIGTAIFGARDYGLAASGPH